MKAWLALGAFCVAAIVALALVLSGGGGEVKRTASAGGDRDRGAEHGDRFEVADPDKHGRPGTITPAKEAFSSRAYPRSYIPAAAVRRATRQTRALPTRLRTSQFRRGVRGAAASATVGTDWNFLGPTRGFAPGPTTESLKDSITSGRVTALAVDPNCGQAGKGCRLWVAAAGGGIWRTDDAKAATVVWRAVDDGLPTNAFGALIVDPTDPSGD